MRFEWDAAKARDNEAKHGVSSAEAAEAFGDNHSSVVNDPDLGEDRFLIFGISRTGRYLIVSYTERGERVG